MNLKKHILPNGLRAVLIPMPEATTVTVQILVEAGSRDESKKIAGISHFLEHMCFKGTTLRPSAFAITRELDSLGSQSNAFTSHEYTGYFAKSHFRHLPQIFDIVSDIYLHSTFPEAEIAKEKGVVIEEINMYNDQPDHLAHEMWRTLIYGDTPMGRPVIGSRETVSALTRKDIVRYHDIHYNAGRTVIAIAGRFNEDEVLSRLRAVFGTIKRGDSVARSKPILPSKKPRVHFTFRKSDQAHVVLGVPGYSASDPKKYVLAVLSGILGAGMSSRLFQKLREELGAAYYVYSRPSFSTDAGFLQIAAGVDKKRVKMIIEEIQSELKKLTVDFVEDEEFERAKEYLTGNMFLDLETTDEIASYFGGQEIMRQPLEFPSEKERKIRAVTKEDVRAVARELFSGRGMSASIAGPFRSIPGIEEALML